MKRNGTGILLVGALLLSAGLLTLGCQSSTSSGPEGQAPQANAEPAPQAPQANAQPAQPNFAQAPAGEGPVQARQEKDDGMVPPGGGGPGQMLDEAARRKRIEEERQKAIVESLLGSARTAMSQFEYRKALNFVDQALELEPLNKEARDLRHEIGAILGQSDDQLETTTEMIRKEIEVRRQEARKRAEVLFQEGEEHFQKKDYEAAISNFEKVLEIIDWAPYELNLTNLRDRAENLKRRAEVERDKNSAEIRRVQLEGARRAAIEEEERRQAQKLAQIRRLFLEAIDAFQRREYNKAEDLAQQVLELDPKNFDAQRLIDHTIDARHEKVRADYIETRIQEWLLFQESIKESRIPYSEILLFPDEDKWKMVDSRESAGAEATQFAARKSERELFIENQLETTTFTFQGDDVPFDDVIQVIRDTGQIDIVVDRQVTEENPDLKVKVNFKNLKLKNALNLILNLNALTYTISKGVVYITTRDSDAGRVKPVTRLHDVRDLTLPINDFPGPDIRLGEASGDGAGGGAIFEEDTGGGPQVTTEEIEELIRQTIAPESWETEGNSMTLVGGQLLIANTPDVHGEVERFLNDLRSFSRAMVSIESRFLTVTDDFLQFIGVDLRGLGISAGPRDANSLGGNVAGNAGSGDFEVLMDDLNQVDGGQFDNNGNLLTVNQAFQPAAGFFFNENGNYKVSARNEAITDRALGNRLQPDGGLAMQIAILSSAQFEWVVRAVEKEQKATVLSSPRLTVYNTQRANIRILNQVTYIKDFDVTIAQSAVIADPIVGVVQEGLVLDVRPTISHDRRYITMEVRPKFIQLDSVTFPPDGFRRVTTTLGGNTVPVVIEVPNLIERSIETTVRLPDRGAILIGGLKESRSVDQRAEVPFLNKIPLVNFFFGSRGKDEETQMLIIILHGTIVDLEETQEEQVGVSR